MQLYVSLSKTEMNALVELARVKRRRPQEQAAMLIAEALHNRTCSLLHTNSFTIASTADDEREVADEA